MSEKKVPAGGRKGGTQFPQVTLKKAVEFANKLFAKVHTGPQIEAVILKGVFNNAGSNGKIRASALKQYNLMRGLRSAYDATELARAIQSAPPEELRALLVRACLSPKVFKTLYDTFQDDTVSRAKIRQQVLQLKVHPDTGDKCVEIFVESLLYAGLGTEQNGEIAILGVSRLTNSVAAPSADVNEGAGLEFPEEGAALEKMSKGVIEEATTASEQDAGSESEQRAPAASGTLPVGPKAQFQVALNLDTMDPEKLEKHMKILKRYGVIG